MMTGINKDKGIPKLSNVMPQGVSNMRQKVNLIIDGESHIVEDMESDSQKSDKILIQDLEASM